MKAFLKTGGCKLNGHLAAKLASSLIDNGYEMTNSADEADTIIVSVCVVTAKAQSQFRRSVLSLRKKYPNKRIILTGCVPDEIKEYGEFADQFEFMDITDITQRHTRQELLIQTGCNNFCSYCIVPYYRGPEYSRPAADIIREADEYVNRGVKELVLTGVHIGRYCDNGMTLPGLLKKLKDRGIFRIRLSSLDPNEVSDELLYEMSGDDTVARFIHLSLQHTRDSVLSSMKRNYAFNDIKKITGKIKASMPHCLIGGDIIAGYPAEDKDAFDKLYRDMEALPIHHFHVFSFSKRPGTLAYFMHNDNKPAEVKRRVHALMALGERKKAQFIMEQLGTRQDIIIEGVKHDMPQGTSSNYLTVFIENAPDTKKGDIVPVLLREYNASGNLLATPIQ